MKSKKIKCLILIIALFISRSQLYVFSESNNISNSNIQNITGKPAQEGNLELDGQIGDWDPNDPDSPNFNQPDLDVDGTRPGEKDYYTISVTVPISMRFIVLPSSSNPLGLFYSPEYSITNNGSKALEMKINDFKIDESTPLDENETLLHIGKIDNSDKNTQMELKLSTIDNSNKYIDLTQITTLTDEQKKLFGTDHIYGLDPFNEVDPPSFEPEYLRKIASDMYATLTAADPKAQWMQMTWMFYFDKDKWTSERMKALLTGVPQNKMILLDYHCENVELWKRTEHFHDQPYIWCYLGNFGGNTTLTGNVKESGARLENALINGGGNLKGIGSTLEGLDVMQFPYEYILEKAWNLNVDDNKWIECLADRHVGCVSQSVRDAWKRLFNDIYVQVPRTLGTLPGYRPALNKNSEKRTSNVYSNVELLEVWRKLNEAPSDRRDAFRLDLITVGRQVLGNYFLDVKVEFDRMVEAKDHQALKACGEKMKEILNDLDKLNAFHPYCSLDKWIDDARKMGDSPQLKDYYEKNARNLITTWGGSLNDYASRSWAGLISDYYAKRWEVYIDTFIKAVGEGVEVDQKQLEDELKEIEEGWVNATDRKDVRKDVHSTTDGLLSFSTFLFSKYQRLVK